VGSWVGKLMDPHLDPHSHIMSSIDRHIILYLEVFAVGGFRVGKFQAFISCVLWLHFVPKRSLIYILTIEIPELLSLISPALSLTDCITTLSDFSTFCNGGLTGSQVGGFTKIPNATFSHPSHKNNH
jgi:hypothetical protein